MSAGWHEFIYFVCMLLCFAAALRPIYSSAAPVRAWLGLHTGWLALGAWFMLLFLDTIKTSG